MIFKRLQKLSILLYWSIFDSERNFINVGVDFAMVCVVFLCLKTFFYNRKKVGSSTSMEVSGGKLNLVGRYFKFREGYLNLKILTIIVNILLILLK